LYAEGTVHLVVVDPGVGAVRRPLACQADGRFVVAPDNGILSRVLAACADWRAVDLSSAVAPDAVAAGRSSTFHGRDVFAPAAADLARGRPLDELGPPVIDPVRIEEPSPVREGGRARGVIVGVDRFGNLLTNLPGSWLERGRAAVEVRGRRLSAASTYGDVAPGELLALVNSDGRVEIAARDDSAAEHLGAGPGTEVLLLSPE
jgi:S-adenosyl-L-methionine hydrolase (adenosine-forming)